MPPADRVGRPLPQPFEWLFRDRVTGGITVAQSPNAALAAFLVAAVVRWVVSPAGAVRTALDVVAGLALAWWAIDEVTRGVNPWRRLLGVSVLVVMAIGVVTR
ncbi:MAG TPA: hypothetical protein VFI47_22020 [Acidimicrobiales bacterium]|nr:hypothetical protein [Acidimicrobiales bacterium]